MVNSKDIQALYNDLYMAFREYIWDIETVRSMADLEVAIYHACPDVANILRCLDLLDKSIYKTGLIDDELNMCLDNIYNLICGNEAYCSIEVIM